MPAASEPPFGPFRVRDPVGLGMLAALAACHCGTDHELVSLLRRADTDDDARDAALVALDGLPALTRRRILATFARLTAPVKSGR